MISHPTIQSPLADKLKSIELKNDISDVFKKSLFYFNDSSNNNNNINPNSTQKLQKEILLSRLVKEDLPVEILESKVNLTEIDDLIKKIPKLPDDIFHQLFVPDILLKVKSTLTLDNKEIMKDIEERENQDNTQQQLDYPNNYYIYKLCCGAVDLDRIDEFGDDPGKE